MSHKIHYGGGQDEVVGQQNIYLLPAINIEFLKLLCLWHRLNLTMKTKLL